MLCKIKEKDYCACKAVNICIDKNMASYSALVGGGITMPKVLDSNKPNDSVSGYESTFAFF